MATATLTAGSRVRTVEPWMSSATADYDNDRVEYYGDDLDDNVFEDDLDDDPEALAEIDRRLDEIDAKMAAGTLVTYTTDEVFERLHKKYPQVFGVKHGL